MTETIKHKEKIDSYLEDYQKVEKSLGEQEPKWLRQIRKEAISRFRSLGFPTTKDEEWRQTNVAPIINQSYSLAEKVEYISIPEKLRHVSFPGAEFIQIVFVNGFFSTQLSDVSSLPEGVFVDNLSSVLKKDSGEVEPYLSRLGSYEDHPFAALNTALFQDGAYVHIRNDVVVDKPIHFLFLSTADKDAIISYPRTLVVVGKNSRVTLVESYAGSEGEVYFTNSVTEIIANENTNIDHYKLQRESTEAFHIANLLFYLDRSSNFSSHSLSFGGGLARNNVNAILGDEGIECTVNGLVMGRGKQHIDNHTYIDHAKPHCNSYELYKHVLDEKSRGVFKGKILVRQDSQKTDALQTNKTLLLSEEASIDTMPQLEIYADDVKCTHGATTGQLDKESLFYLQSRGISKESAKNLLTYAFANDLVERIKVDSIRNQLEKELHERLPFEN